MQDRYVGDVGDFGKYGLLRALCGAPGAAAAPLRLGVVWYLVPPGGPPGDGRHTGYLAPHPAAARRFRACDAALYDGLRALLARGARTVAAVAEAGLLPADTVFFAAPLLPALPGAPARGVTARRLALRRAWLAAALAATAPCDLVFLDPDNGLECRVPRTSPMGVKYAYYDEVVAFAAQGQSVVVYHHTGRQGSARDQAEARLAALAERLPGAASPLGLLFRRGSCRAFFVVPAPAHANGLAARLRGLLAGPWAQHFEAVGEGPPVAAAAERH